MGFQRKWYRKPPLEVIEAFRTELKTVREEINELEDRQDRYRILRNIVVSQTDLDEDTLDQLVEQRRKMEEGQWRSLLRKWRQSTMIHEKL